MEPRFPWREYRRFCLGVLGWSPADFWKATVWDVADAYEGWAQANGIKKKHDLPDEESRKALRARLEREGNG